MENRRETMQEQAWWKLHCASCLLVFCAVVWCCWCWLRSEWGKKTIQTYPYSNCTFHHQNSQRKQTNFTVPTDLGKTLANTIYCMCLFQHVGKQDRTHARTNMVKIALRKLFAGILCGCVVLLVLVVKWVMKKNNPNTSIFELHFPPPEFTKKTNKFYRTNRPRENFGQHNLLHVSLSACWKTGQNPCKNKHGENCIAQVVCWHFVRLCGAAGVGGEVSDEKKQSKHIHIRTAFSTTRIHKENKQILPYQPTLLKTLTNIIYCMCFFQHVGKQDRTHARTHMVKIALRKLFAGILCGCVVLLVLVVKWVMKKTIQTDPYSNCTFHHQNSQRKPTSFTVPTNLGTTLANIICCMCIFQHVGKQDRIHARTNMVKIALRKLFAGILCGCVVLLVLVVKWVMKKTIQTHPYSNCIFHHQNSKRKQTSFKVPTNLIGNFYQHNLLPVSLSACWKTGQNPCKNTNGENCIAQVGCWYFVRLCGAAGVGCEVSDAKKHPNLSIF